MKGWTVLIFSDHALVSPKHDMSLLMGLTGVSIPMMEELGYTKTYKDENGKVKIDWSQTKSC